MTSFYRGLLACAALLALSTAGCSTLDEMMRTQESAKTAAEQPVHTAAEAASDETPPAASSGEGSNATCCVNGAFYACPGIAAATQCLGEPMSLVNCLGECSGTEGDCENACADKYGPDPSSCQRDAAQDGSCDQK